MGATTPGLISIVMPCYNAAQYLASSVASALEQSYGKVELIVVDDGSRDESLDILREIGERDPRLKVVSQQNRGPGPARNRGLREARGEFVAFLDSDDYWAPDCLEKLHDAIVRSGAALVYCGWQNVRQSGENGKPFVPPDYNAVDKVEAVLTGCRWPIHGALTRRQAIESVGGFDERWSTSMDFDLWLRLASRHEIALVPEVLAFYRHHEGPQITKNRAKVALNHWAIQNAFLQANPDIAQRFGRQRVRRLTHGELLQKGYACYWERDLASARKIFRKVMAAGYGSWRDWKYLLPALLPLGLHRSLIRLLESKTEAAR